MPKYFHAFHAGYHPKALIYMSGSEYDIRVQFSGYFERYCNFKVFHLTKSRSMPWTLVANLSRSQPAETGNAQCHILISVLNNPSLVKWPLSWFYHTRRRMRTVLVRQTWIANLHVGFSLNATSTDGIFNCTPISPVLNLSFSKFVSMILALLSTPCETSSSVFTGLDLLLSLTTPIADFILCHRIPRTHFSSSFSVLIRFVSLVVAFVYGGIQQGTIWL